MSLVSFIFGFVAAFVLMGTIGVGCFCWWMFSYMKHRQEQVDPKNKAMKIAKKPPYIVKTDQY